MTQYPQSARYNVTKYTFKGKARLQKPFVDLDLAIKREYADKENSVTGLICIEDIEDLARYIDAHSDLEKNNSIFVFSDPKKEPGKNIVNTVVPAGFIIELPSRRQEPTFLQREILMEQSIEAAIITKQNIIIPMSHLDNLAYFTFLENEDGALKFVSAYDLIGVENEQAKIKDPDPRPRQERLTRNMKKSLLSKAQEEAERQNYKEWMESRTANTIKMPQQSGQSFDSPMIRP